MLTFFLHLFQNLIGAILLVVVDVPIDSEMCGDFINLDDFLAQSVRGAHRGKVAHVYS